MTVGTFRPSVLATRPDNGSPAANYAADFIQERYAVLVETACTWFRSVETLCRPGSKQPAKPSMRAKGQQKKLRTAGAPAKLLDIHADLMKFYLDKPHQLLATACRDRAADAD